MWDYLSTNWVYIGLGMVCGILPLAAGLVLKQRPSAIIGFLLCTIGGAVSGISGGVLAAIISSIVIFVIGKKA